MPWTTTDEFNVIIKTQRMSLASFPGYAYKWALKWLNVTTSRIQKPESFAAIQARLSLAVKDLGRKKLKTVYSQYSTLRFVAICCPIKIIRSYLHKGDWLKDKFTHKLTFLLDLIVGLNCGRPLCCWPPVSTAVHFGPTPLVRTS